MKEYIKERLQYHLNRLDKYFDKDELAYLRDCRLMFST